MLALPSFNEAERRYSLHYVSVVHSNSFNFERLDRDFPQIQTTCSWLVQKKNGDLSAAFLQLVYALAPYLQRSALHKTLLQYCQLGLQFASQLGQNAGRLLLLQSRAYWALGEWDQALARVRAAINVSNIADPKVHAQSVLALGQLQLNRGEYRVALQTLSQAEKLLSEISDEEGIAAAKAEVAAYFLNRLEYRKALALYLEVDQRRRSVDPGRSSAHTLLMLGVIYRRLRNYAEAEKYLRGLIELCCAEGNSGSLATAMHHLGWIYFDQAEYAEAERLARTAKRIYENVGDPRGESDADEQLGRMALAKKDWASARFFLERSLTVRTQLGNQHGVASSLRRLAQLFLKQGKLWTGIGYLCRCLCHYQHLGALSHQRLGAIVFDLSD